MWKSDQIKLPFNPAPCYVVAKLPHSKMHLPTPVVPARGFRTTASYPGRLGPRPRGPLTGTDPQGQEVTAGLPVVRTHGARTPSEAVRPHGSLQLALPRWPTTKGAGLAPRTVPTTEGS